MLELVDRLLAGDRRAAARLISLIEDDGEQARSALADLYPHTGRAAVIGVTGPAGSGKSTLVDHLARRLRRRGQTVGIIAVDPTSPFSGGAILGDRIRMQELTSDPGIFIRSMATRGSLGGLARATGDAVLVLDALGKEVILVETVGVGQDEVEIAKAAQTTLVVQVPGLGDDIQAIKAGILEIADILVVNKADREGSDRLVASLEMVISGGSQAGSDQAWTPPIVSTIAYKGVGIDELLAAIDRHQAYRRQSGMETRQRWEWAEGRLLTILEMELVQRARRAVGPAAWATCVADIADRRADPYTAAGVIMRSLGIGD